MSKFTAEEKLQAVQRYLNGNESYKDIGQSIDKIISNYSVRYC
ncbi:hypothetical protein ACQKOF_16170 [Lysinibacillus sp. NPDC093190]